MSIIKDKLASEGIAGTGNNQPTDTDTKPKPDAPTPGKEAPNDDDIDDERLLRAFNKKNGTAFTSLAEISQKPADAPAPPTEEELERIKSEKRTKARAYGLQKNIVTSDDLDSHAREATLSPYEIGLQLYKAERKAEEEGITDEEAQEEFDLLYQQNRPDTDKKKIYANKLLQQQYDSYMKSKYGKVLDLETAYDAEETTQQQRTKYTSLVEKAFAKLPKKLAQELQDGDNKHNYEFELSDETLQALRNTYAGEEMFAAFGTKELTPDKLAEAMKLTAIQREFPKILQTVAIAHRSNAQLNRDLSRRGILPDNTSGMGGADHSNNNGNRGNVTGSHAKAKLQAEKSNRY